MAAGNGRWFSGNHAMAIACLLVLVGCMLWPMSLILAGGFRDEAGHFTLDHLRGVLADPVLRDGLINSLIVAILTTGLCFLIALPLATLTTRYRFPFRNLLSALLLVPLILPPFVGVIGLRHLFGTYGAVNAALAGLGWIDPTQPIDFLGGGGQWAVPWLGWSIDGRLIGIVILEALHLYPILYLNATAAMSNVDPALEQAAENLGASSWQRFRRVTIPLVLPGLFAGGTIVFIWSLTELGTPLMFDYLTITPVQVFYSIQEVADSARPYALVTVMLLLAVVAYGIGKGLFGHQAHAMQSRAASTHDLPRLQSWRGALVVALFSATIFIALLPHLGVVLVSVTEPGGWYRSVLPESFTGHHFVSALTHPLAAGSIRNSLVYASGALLFALVLGTAIAWVTVRGRVRGSLALDSLAMLPLAVPGLVLAFGYVAVSVQIKGWYASAGQTPPSVLQVIGEAPNPIVFLIIAYAIRRLPYVVRSVAAGLQQTSEELEAAAHNLGAGRGQTLRRVVLPLIAANIIAGGLLAFSFAMLEVSDSLILAQTEQHYPLTKAIFTLFERLGDGAYVASAMGVWGMALLTVTMIGTAMILGKRMGSVFRL